MASSRAAPTGSPIICARSASAPTSWSASASSAPSTWWSVFSASSRPAAPICRSIPASPPPAPLAYMLADARAPVLITQDALADLLPESEAVRIRLDADAPAIARQPTTAPDSGADPLNPAYVVFTSGSTGRPKGTLVTHDCVTRLFAATDSWFGFGPHDVWTLFHSFAFDFSVWELFGALLHGGRLVIVPYWVTRPPG